MNERETHDQVMSTIHKTEHIGYHGLSEYIGAKQEKPNSDTHKEQPSNEVQEQPSNEAQEQPRNEAQEQPSNETDQDNQIIVTTKTNLIRLKRNDKIRCKLDDDDQWKEVTILCRGGKTTGKYKNWLAPATLQLGVL